MAAFQTALGKTAGSLEGRAEWERRRDLEFSYRREFSRVNRGPPRGTPAAPRLLGPFPFVQTSNPCCPSPRSPFPSWLLLCKRGQCPHCDRLPAPSGVESSPRAGLWLPLCPPKSCYTFTEDRIQVGTRRCVPQREGQVWSLSRVLVTSAPSPALHGLSAHHCGQDSQYFMFTLNDTQAARSIRHMKSVTASFSCSSWSPGGKSREQQILNSEQFHVCHLPATDLQRLGGRPWDTSQSSYVWKGKEAWAGTSTQLALSGTGRPLRDWERTASGPPAMPRAAPPGPQGRNAPNLPTTRLP